MIEFDRWWAERSRLYELHATNAQLRDGWWNRNCSDNRCAGTVTSGSRTWQIQQTGSPRSSSLCSPIARSHDIFINLFCYVKIIKRVSKKKKKKTIRIIKFLITLFWYKIYIYLMSRNGENLQFILKHIFIFLQRDCDVYERFEKYELVKTIWLRIYILYMVMALTVFYIIRYLRIDRDNLNEGMDVLEIIKMSIR